jgi:hypothetical protein
MTDIISGRYSIFPMGVTFTSSTSQSGSSIFIDSATSAFDITLPAPSYSTIGLQYKFILKTGGNEVRIDGGAGKCYGIKYDKTADPAVTIEVSAVASSAPVRFVIFADVAVSGDTIEMSCDGSYWIFKGVSASEGGILTSN